MTTIHPPNDPTRATDRRLRVDLDLLAPNDRIAADNRTWLTERGVLALNLVSSPGSGKTTLLCATLQRLDRPSWVIEGDQATSRDADRIRATGTPTLQINTGQLCHLEASMVREGLRTLPIDQPGVLFIENVGNLVCPAAFDLGESRRVVLASTTEGEDKPLKYPGMFASADLVIVTKMDLAGLLGTDVERLEENARRLRPGVEILRLSARTGEGMDGWLGWLARREVRGD